MDDFFFAMLKIAPIVWFVLLGVIFCLEFNPFLFFSFGFGLLLFSLLPGFFPFFPFFIYLKYWIYRTFDR